jgi:hypothetical protein
MLLLYALDPFEPDFLTHGEPSAYPPDRSVVVLPSVMYLGWNDVSADVFMADVARLSAASLVEAAIRTPIIGLRICMPVGHDETGHRTENLEALLELGISS